MEWRAHIIEDWPTGGHRLILARRIRDHLDIVTGFEPDGTPNIEEHDPLTTPDFQGLRLPMGALEAIAAAARPGPSHAELTAVREALDIERRRVDDVLDRTVTGPA